MKAWVKKKHAFYYRIYLYRILLVSLRRRTALAWVLFPCRSDYSDCFLANIFLLIFLPCFCKWWASLWLSWLKNIICMEKGEKVFFSSSTCRLFGTESGVYFRHPHQHDLVVLNKTQQQHTTTPFCSVCIAAYNKRGPDERERENTTIIITTQLPPIHTTFSTR